MLSDPFGSVVGVDVVLRMAQVADDQAHHGGGVAARATPVADLRELVEEFAITAYEAGQVPRSTRG